MKVWSWRHAIQKSALPALTKLVLYNLAIHMNEAGENCFPSLDRQAQDTGMSRRSIVTHLRVAEQAGFFTKKAHGFGNRSWKRHEYIPCFPAGMEFGTDIEKTEEKGGAGAALPPDEVVQLVHCGGASDDNEAVQELHSKDTSITLSGEVARTDVREAPQEILEGKRKRSTPPISVDYYRSLCIQERGAGLDADERQCKDAYEQWERGRVLTAPGTTARAAEVMASLVALPLAVIESRAQVAWDKNILPAMRAEHGDATFKNWFGMLRLHRATDNAALLTVPTAFAKSHIEKHYLPGLAAQFSRAGYATTRIEVRG